MTTHSELSIARDAQLKPLTDIAGEMGIGPHLLELYGESVAKISLAALDELASRPPGRYVLVSAITPTPLGEGKTTTVVGLGQAFQYLGRSATVAIRQPSLGPTFGIKGGAAGAGHTQLRGNDRALRNIVIGLGDHRDGVPRQTGFDITAASEVMAILALATSQPNLRARLGRIAVGYTRGGEPVVAEQLGAAGAMAAILADAIKPNLLQTLEHTPVLLHAGPFGNIAHGNSSILADLIGIRTGDFLLTEAGFGADMGAERFFNIKCRVSGLRPDAAVIVATVRGLKAQSGRYHIVAGKPLPDGLLAENPEEVLEGAANLRKQVDNIRAHGVPAVVAINAFPSDHRSEWRAIAEIAESMKAPVAVSRHVANGGRGATELAEAVAEAAQERSAFRLLYPDDVPLRDKIETVARRIYGADRVEFAPAAGRQLDAYERQGYGRLPICIAKTHLSLSSDPTLTGAPTGWTLPVREVRAAAGAGFIYPICGDMRTMPGLGSHPAAERIDVADNGDIVGLS